MASQSLREVIDLAHAVGLGHGNPSDLMVLFERGIGADAATFTPPLVQQDSTGSEMSYRHTAPLTFEELTQWKALLPSYPYLQFLAGSSPGVSRATDVMTVREMQRHPVVDRLLRPRSLRYQMGVLLTSGEDGPQLLSLWRSSRDFSAAEVALGETLRRPLTAALQLAAAIRQLQDSVAAEPRETVLSVRQAQVAALVAAGMTNEAIGRRLGISTRTVRKHVEDCFRRTTTGNRAALASWVAKAPRLPLA